MPQPTDEQIAALLTGIISDGFNRSISALEKARAVDTGEMRTAYSGIGSKYYDMVTIEIERTARLCLPAVRRLFVDGERI